jgi:hypothetical protein
VVVAGWSDGMSHAQPGRMPAKVHSNNWGALAGEGPASAHVQANQGWEVVISTPEVLYFDSPQAADPKERGYDWPSRATDTRKVFDFMPENLPAHAELWPDLQGRPQASKDDHPLEPGVRFNGLQGQLWSETIRSDAQVDYMLYPRLLALAERAWHGASWETPYTPARPTTPRPAPSRPKCGPGATPTGPPSPTCWAGASWPGWTRRAWPTASRRSVRWSRTAGCGPMSSSRACRSNTASTAALAALCGRRDGRRQGRGAGPLGRWQTGRASRRRPLRGAFGRRKGAPIIIIALHKNHGRRRPKGRQDASGRPLRSDDGCGACRNFSFDKLFQLRQLP